MRILADYQINAIVDRLAWTDGSLDEEVCVEFDIDMDVLEWIMHINGYGWDYDCELWVSKRDLWDSDGSTIGLVKGSAFREVI